MNYLLDTHVFLWFASDDIKLSPVAKEIIENGKNNIYLSSASVWELSIKIIIGKLKLKKDLNKFIAENIARYAYIPLPVTIPHALEISKLPEIHKDPFDRMLVAQALAEKMKIITSDSYIRKYNVKTAW
ncbi:MAG: type II toxin-antitoxin system VapC family toxin [Candidatus Acididesulfobacter guangdongensis]|uniref:Type II toxin-antitoxin system VapC family toxin n=1 Tax=Acididesulfobacter guangdongensis TaxID=2597225 RepID=A0A519BFB3_ACIG2|nr:MAG: type II toxin-antitoxin system VapC family toxin [Candidatus Acididesulfobacter guangdongensis]